MKHFILEDQLIENIKKNISLFNDYYKHNVESIYFNNLKYNDYFLSILYPKNHIFNDFVNSNKNLIIPTIGISRILPSSNMSSFIAHKHLYDVDDVIYHYIVKCNSRCGMIIGDEYLPYKDELIFGTHPTQKPLPLPASKPLWWRTTSWWPWVS